MKFVLEILGAFVAIAGVMALLKIFLKNKQTAEGDPSQQQGYSCDIVVTAPQSGIAPAEEQVIQKMADRHEAAKETIQQAVQEIFAPDSPEDSGRSIDQELSDLYADLESMKQEDEKDGRI